MRFFYFRRTALGIERLFELFFVLEKPLDCARGDNTKKASAKARPKGTPQLFSKFSCFFIESIRAMSAATFTAMTAFEVVIFGKTFVAFGREIEIFAFCGFIFVILLMHSCKFINFRRMLLIVSKFLIPKGYRGMTVYPFVFVRDRNEKDYLVLMNHERIHLRQQLELLVLPFFVWYGIDFLVKLIRYRDKKKAYRKIIFEREAYANENDLNYLSSRPLWKFRSYF
jgi:hypothetical protein